jgi:hypothetical protein
MSNTIPLTTFLDWRQHDGYPTKSRRVFPIDSQTRILDKGASFFPK